MRPFLFIAFLLTVSASKTSSPIHDSLRCVLAADKTAYKLGELPAFTVEIYNNTRKDVYLIGSLDGSDIQWRFPHCYFTIDKPKPDTITLARCGNMNTLRLADFMLVKPGQKFNPYIGGYGFFQDYETRDKETFKNPGVYKIKFHYSTNSKNICDFLGDRSPRRDEADSIRINLLFKSVPKVDITSNEIQIKVEE